MCGRTSLANLPEHLQPFLLRYGIHDSPPWYTPRYNIAPSQTQMIIVERDGEREARAMKWGLVPFWAKDPSIGNRMINARVETLATKPAYREAFAKRRGLMVVDSYYEWRVNPAGPKTPFRVHLEGDAPFTLGALWERWGPKDEPLETCTVITTAAGPLMSRIHDRKPLVVSESAAAAWLDSNSSSATIQEIVASDDEHLLADPVSFYVNVPSNDGPLCWETVEAD
ncbi:MAG: SOS response-associated peptidase [Gemmatimonadaceae bacterium]